MNKIFIQCVITAMIFLASACGDNHHHDNGTHTHDDGTIHQDHGEQLPEQEEFNVTADSSITIENDSVHVHDHDHPHQH